MEHMLQTITEVLLIDDDADEHAVFRLALQDIIPQAKLVYVKSCTAALTELIDCKPDLIFLDLNMPNLDGFDCIKALKSNARLCNIPIIIYSGSNNPKDIERGGIAGATLYFEKCFSYPELVAALKAIIHSTHKSSQTEQYKVYKNGKIESFAVEI